MKTLPIHYVGKVGLSCDNCNDENARGYYSIPDGGPHFYRQLWTYPDTEICLCFDCTSILVKDNKGKVEFDEVPRD